MNHSHHDPELQAFEAKLAGLIPPAPAEQHDELLYACGFAAGRQQGVRSLRRWQVAAAVLGLTVAAVSGLAIRPSERQLAQQEQRTSPERQRPAAVDDSSSRDVSPAVAVLPAGPDSLAELLDRHGAVPATQLALDAWQRGTAEERPAALEAAAHPLSVASLTHSLLPSPN